MLVKEKNKKCIKDEDGQDEIHQLSGEEETVQHVGVEN